MNDLEELEKLLLDQDSFDKLESCFNNKPNIFSILKIENREIRHSNILAWLLNPNEDHNLNSLFLKEFINLFVKEYTNNKEYTKLLSMNYDDVSVKREWKNIDLLLIPEKQKTVIAMENKINSKEHDNQLQRYYDIILENFKGYDAYFIFLTLDGSEPENMNDVWQTMSYKAVAEIIEKILKKQSLSAEVKLIMENYEETIRSLINMENPEVKELCIQIYKKHKRAIDLIMENVPANESAFLNDLSDWVIKDWSKKYKFKNVNNHKWFEFSSNLMDELLPNVNGNIAYKYFISVVTSTQPWYCKISFELQYDGIVNTTNYELAKIMDREINKRNLEERGKNHDNNWNAYGFKNWQINVDEENYEEEWENIKASFEKILFKDIPELEEKIKKIKENNL